MKNRLHISDGFSLPADVITEKLAILARTGAGKSYTATVLAEEFLKADYQIAIIDLTGAWWGLRSSADGKKPGFKIFVFGGDHGDIPLEPTAGKMMADLVASEHISVVFDLSNFESRSQEIKFVTDFMEQLYRKNRKAMHLFVDEGDSFAPQSPMPEDRRMLGAMNLIWKRGRIRGIGGTIISQRSAAVNKNVLSQSGILVALQTTGTHDRKALKEWAEGKATPEQMAKFLESIASIPIGTAWIWWPAHDIFKTVKIRTRETFDSGRTPKPGERISAPKAAAEVNLDLIRKQMAATVEKAKAEDPKELRRRIVELEREVAKKAVLSVTAPPVVKTIMEPVKVISEREIKRIESVAAKLQKLPFGGFMEDLKEIVAVRDAIEKATAFMRTTPTRPIKVLVPTHTLLPDPKKQPIPSPVLRAPRQEESNGMPKPHKKILGSLAMFLRLGIHQPPREWVAAMAGASHKSSGYEKNVSLLKSLALISYPAPGLCAITDEGLTHAPQSADSLTPEVLLQRCAHVISGPQQRLLQILFDRAPHSMTRAELAEAAEVSAISSGYEKNISTLKSAGMIDYDGPGRVRCATWIHDPKGV